jgi:hypothetical protein
MLKALKHALCLDHSPSLSAQWTCPCKLCALANPDKLTPADRYAKTHKLQQCGKQIDGEARRCARAFVHEGRCLP